MPFALKFPVPRVDQVGVEERSVKFTKRSIKNDAKSEGLKMAVSMMDLTTLEGADSKGKVTHLCRKARQPMLAKYHCPPCAAVCVYPNQVPHAVKELEGSGIPVASVATGFPSGQYPLKLRLADVKDAVNSGASEIDMVISRGTFLEGGLAEVFDEIAAVKEACGKAHLKVIFETGELQTYDNVRLVSQLSIEAGADFIKTSTGKVSPAATLPVTLVMVETVRDHYLATGRKIGVKPAGGIRTAKQALQYLVMVKETVGNDWLTPDLFRFGASSLLGDVELQLAKFVDGNYQSAVYFSKG
ncbi:MAG: deoxyribose-phosphate aldolase [Verrucomicrobiales bacterium]|nr:deoxyribose-phosphate aldolase [Verrucomicrobiales bacterium]|tara:strand:+ start:17369 stop:18268 length:900 start_codon:yes stop_codon:yes gene_type:complete